MYEWTTPGSISIPVTLKLLGQPFSYPPSSLCLPHLPLSSWASPPPVSLWGHADDCWWIVMSIWGKCVCECVPMYGVVNARPAALLSLCPGLTLLQPSGRRHPDSVNNTGSNKLHRRLCPASEEMKPAEGEKGIKDRGDKLIQRFSSRIKEIRLQREWGEA